MAQQVFGNPFNRPPHTRLQCYAITAPDSGEVMKDGIGPIRRIIFNRSKVARQIVRQIAVPIHPNSGPPQASTGSSSNQEATTLIPSSSDFEGLPVELKRSIFKDLLPDLTSFICLALMNEQNWEIYKDLIHGHLIQFLGRWAGKKLLFAGADLHADDYPPGLASMANLVPDGMYYKLSRANFSTIEHVDMKAWYADAFKNIKEKIEAYKKRNKNASDFVDSTFESKLSELQSSITERTYFPGDVWILRCTTRKEFVRPEAIALKTEYIHGPEIDILGFGEVVLMYTAWTKLRNSRGDVEQILARGRWAGCCFDIIPLASHKAETEEAKTETEWKDVSDEAFRLVNAVYTMLLGPRWRELICDPSWKPNMWSANDPEDDLRYPAILTGANP